MTLEQLIEQFRIFGEIQEERNYQDRKWGGPEQDDKLDKKAWPRITLEYLKDAKYAVESGDVAEYRRQMIKVGALALAAIESFDRLDKKTL